VIRNWIFSRKGALALALLALLSNIWRGFLDAMFVMPEVYGDRGTMELAAIVFTLVFVAWAWSLFATWRGSRLGLVAAFVINGLILLAVPVAWLLFYCPAGCRAQAGVFNLANSLNLLFGLLAAVALGLQLLRAPRQVSRQRGEGHV
jgi:hypothetical protein